MNLSNRISFKLQSTKWLFYIGVIMTLIITTFAVTRDTDDIQQKIHETSDLISSWV
jgi:hypothetical protein